MALRFDGSRRPPGRRPAHRGVLVQDISQGAERVRKWPEKRGRTRDRAEKARLDKFRAAQMAAKFMAPQIVQAFTDAVKGTPLMPRDLLTSMVYGRLAMFVLDDGRALWPTVAQNDVSRALDVLSQTPNTILVRGEEAWEGVPYGGGGGGGGSGNGVIPYTLNNANNSTSAYATKGNVFRAPEDTALNLTGLSLRFGAAGDYILTIGTMTEASEIDAILYRSPSRAITGDQFTSWFFPPCVIPAGRLGFAVVSRQGGGGATAANVYFAATVQAAQMFIRHAGGVLFANNNPAVGQTMAFNGGYTVTYMNLLGGFDATSA